MEPSGWLILYKQQQQAIFLATALSPFYYFAKGRDAVQIRRAAQRLGTSLSFLKWGCDVRGKMIMWYPQAVRSKLIIAKQSSESDVAQGKSGGLIMIVFRLTTMRGREREREG